MPLTCPWKKDCCKGNLYLGNNFLLVHFQFLCNMAWMLSALWAVIFYYFPGAWSESLTRKKAVMIYSYSRQWVPVTRQKITDSWKRWGKNSLWDISPCVIHCYRKPVSRVMQNFKRLQHFMASNIICCMCWNNAINAQTMLQNKIQYFVCTNHILFCFWGFGVGFFCNECQTGWTPCQNSVLPVWSIFMNLHWILQLLQLPPKIQWTRAQIPGHYRAYWGLKHSSKKWKTTFSPQQEQSTEILNPTG